MFTEGTWPARKQQWLLLLPHNCNTSAAPSIKAAQEASCIVMHKAKNWKGITKTYSQSTVLPFHTERRSHHTYQQKLLILFVFVREIPFFHIIHILLYGSRHNCMQIGITTEETRTETVGHPQHVRYYQHLPVYRATGSDTDNGNSQFPSHTLCQ